MSDLVYVLDTNVFVEAAKHYYAFDLVPAFWNCLITHSNDGRVKSIDRVKKEIEKGNDQLAEWAKNDFASAFCNTDDTDIHQRYGDIITWVNNNKQFSDAAKAEFARGADGWLIAYAEVNKYTVVTHEREDPLIKRKVPIPNVCNAFGVSFIDTFEMLRKLGVQFT